jgi:hypothetical protein
MAEPPADLPPADPPPAEPPPAETVTAAKCPNCGAPLELMPDGTCRWCHATIQQTTTGDMASANLFFRLEHSWENNWTLAAAPGSRHAIPWDMGPLLLSPAKEILAVLAAGVTPAMQPGLAEIAVTHGQSADLDWELCLIVNDVISAGIQPNEHDGPHAYLEICDLLEAVAHVENTNPQWAESALQCVGEARSRYWSAWMAAVEGDDADPFQSDLIAWIAAQRAQVGKKKHFWQR